MIRLFLDGGEMPWASPALEPRNSCDLPPGATLAGGCGTVKEASQRFLAGTGADATLAYRDIPAGGLWGGEFYVVQGRRGAQSTGCGEWRGLHSLREILRCCPTLIRKLSPQL